MLYKLLNSTAGLLNIYLLKKGYSIANHLLFDTYLQVRLLSQFHTVVKRNPNSKLVADYFRHSTKNAVMSKLRCHEFWQELSLSRFIVQGSNLRQETLLSQFLSPDPYAFQRIKRQSAGKTREQF